VAVDNQIFIRTFDHLYCIQKKEKEGLTTPIY
jgi:hypothetical protein